MGMYTGVRFQAKLKPIVAGAMKLCYDSKVLDQFWDTLSKIIPIDDDWLKTGRRDFIPFGALSYMPDHWDKSPTGLSGEDWNVCCSLKNYEGEIDTFLSKVLPYLISEPCEVEYLYEEWEEPKLYMITPEEYKTQY